MPMLQLSSTLEQLPLHNQRVLLRVDLNVPLAHGTITNDYRLRAIEDTIAIIQQKGGRIILATHLGRPTFADPSLSTKILIPWFVNRGYQITHEPDLKKAESKSYHLQPGKMLMLENLRFFPGEKRQDHEFAQQLAALGDYYVFDAFAVAHRNDTSITLVPLLFPPEKRCIGPLTIRELAMLNRLLDNPKKPFVLILGGGKVHDKIPLLEQLLDHVNTILLCPAAVFTFLKALNQPIGKSLCDDASISLCQKIVREAQSRGVSIMMPLDYQIATETLDGQLSYVDAAQFPANGIGTSIGPKTVAQWTPLLQQAKTIFFNGSIGFSTRPETLTGMRSILQSIANSSAFSVIGGGDSVGVAQQYGLADKISYLSTGGGATLTYLSGQELPGLKAFL